MEKNAANAKTAVELEKKAIQKELTDMNLEFEEMKQEFKDMGTLHSYLADTVTKLKEKVIVGLTRQEEIQGRVFEIKDVLERLRDSQPGNHGKVVRK